VRSDSSQKGEGKERGRRQEGKGVSRVLIGARGGDKKGGMVAAAWLRW
jgi:hypothetical protein